MEHRCWILVDAGKKGSENQAVGLAERMGWSFSLYRLRLPCVDLGRRYRTYIQQLEALSPQPDVILSAGRRSQPVATGFKKRHPEVFLIALLNPLMPLSLFDLVIAPQHEALRGPNVLATKGVLHRITEATLQEGWQRERFASLRRPLLGVLLGGASKDCGWSSPAAESLMAHCPPFLSPHSPRFRVLFETLRQYDKEGWGILVLPSRRTPDWLKEALRECCAGTSIRVEEGTEAFNPYISALAASDMLLVTADSMSMLSEACATHKPVYIFPLAGTSRKLSALHATFCSTGHARIFSGSLDAFTPPPLVEEGLEEEISKRLAEFIGS
ncbi:MAG: mitochondrial fission ELM1 family protein [Holosporales bacterium]|jgi:mitochondrial fission protein ELM1|nr:mitochondrial fission ELM1 family protein [Holosporales bacterium]